MNSLFILSGQSENTPVPPTVHLLDLSNNTWSKPETKGEGPQALSYPAGWYDPPYVFIHGGRTKDKSINETLLLDLETFCWRKIFTMEQPSSRYGHSAVRNKDKQAYIFGGCNIGKKDERYLCDLHKLEYKSIVIVEGDNNNNVNGASWITNIATKGDKPVGRKGYGMIYLQKINSIIIYGGETKQGINDDSVYIFNIDEKEWNKYDIKGDSLNPRAYHLMMLVGENTVIIYGGKSKTGEISDDIISINIPNNEARKIELDKSIQEQRYSMGGCEVIDTEDNCHLMIVGGKGNKYYEMNVIDIIISNEYKNVNNNEISRTREVRKSPPKQIPSHLPPTNKKGIPISSHTPQPLTENKNQKEREKCVKELMQLQNLFLEKYDQNQKITIEYNSNLAELAKCQKKLTEQNLELSEKNINTIQKEKKRDKIIKDIMVLAQKKNKLAEHNQLLNSYINIQKESFCVISELLTDSMEEIIRMDDYILKTKDQNVIVPGVDYETLSKNRKKYTAELKSLFTDFNGYTKYEVDINSQINIKQKEMQNLEYKPSLSFQDSNVNDSLELN